MFKQILENKISDKLTNFNNAGKLATNLFDKFRNSLDLNDGPPSHPTTPTHKVPNANFQVSHSNTSLNENTTDDSNNSYFNFNEYNMSKRPYSVVSTNDHKLKSSEEIQFNGCSYDYNEESEKKKIFSDDTKIPSKTAASHNRVLVRQSTDLTCKFPVRPFQRINSETVEIPGLNVKVVRYRIEDDLGKIEPQMYIKNNSNGVDLTNSTSKGKINFTVRYNEDIQSLTVTINTVEIFVHPHFNSPNTTLNNKRFEYSDDVVSSANKPDTYVKIQLYPGNKKQKYQTKIQRKTCTPVFEETFYFSVPFQDLPSKSLNITVLDFGRFTKHSLIGSVRLNDLHCIKDLTTKDIDFSKNLLPLTEVSNLFRLHLNIISII